MRQGNVFITTVENDKNHLKTLFSHHEKSSHCKKACFGRWKERGISTDNKPA